MNTMKWVFITLIILSLSCSRNGDIKTTVDLFNHYQKKEGYVTFKVSSKMLELFLDTKADNELINNLKEIKHIRVMLYNNTIKDHEILNKELNTVISYYTRWNYNNYCNFKDTVENILVKYKESLPFKYSEMVVFLRDEQGFLVISFMDKTSENHLIPLLKPENLERIKALKEENSFFPF